MSHEYMYHILLLEFNIINVYKNKLLFKVLFCKLVFIFPTEENIEGRIEIGASGT